jgi:hypothetical protein
MTSALFVLLSAAVLSSSLAILLAALERPWLADAMVVTAAACGLSAFALMAAWTVRRARHPRPEARR